MPSQGLKNPLAGFPCSTRKKLQFNKARPSIGLPQFGKIISVLKRINKSLKKYSRNPQNNKKLEMTPSQGLKNHPS